MREEFKYDTWGDFKQRYQNTYGWYEKASGDKVLVLLDDITDRNCRFLDAEGCSFVAHPDKGNHFQFIPVRRGLYHTERYGVVYCRRFPAKQYKRGIACSNTALFGLAVNQPLSLDFHIIESMFGEDHEHRRVEQIDKLRASLHHSALLNNAFYIQHFSLYLYNNYIGAVDPSARVISLSSTLFKQEVEDVLRVNNLDYIVEA